MEEKYDSYIEATVPSISPICMIPFILPSSLRLSSCVIAVMMVFAALGGGMQQFLELPWVRQLPSSPMWAKVFEPLESIGMEIQNIQSAVAGVKRINEFLSERERTVPEGTSNRAFSDANGESAISFDNVEFGYDDKTVVLQDMSFSVQQGEAVTFIGRTGAGKSTLFKLILGLYAPQKGQILINDIDAAQISDKRKAVRLCGADLSFSCRNCGGANFSV